MVFEPVISSLCTVLEEQSPAPVVSLVIVFFSPKIPSRFSMVTDVSGRSCSMTTAGSRRSSITVCALAPNTPIALAASANARTLTFMVASCNYASPVNASPPRTFPKFPRKLRTRNVIDLYTWTTPNGRKASIALEEFGLPYTVHPIDISKDEQFAPDFLKIAPNNRIPAIVDRDTNIALMESGAILIYLADKTGKLMPKSGEGRYRVIEWLMWQMGGPGPMLGQVHHFVKYNKGKAPYAEERYLKEGQRLYKVLNTRLEGR